MRFFPHFRIPLWIRGRVLPTLDEPRPDRADPELQALLERGLREEQRQQAANREQPASRRKTG